jgi:hypothetical protein
VNQDHGSHHLLSELKQRKSIDVYLYSFQSCLGHNCQNILVLTLLLLDVCIFEITFFVLGLPLADLLDPRFLHLLKIKPFFQVQGIQHQRSWPPNLLIRNFNYLFLLFLSWRLTLNREVIINGGLLNVVVLLHIKRVQEILTLLTFHLEGLLELGLHFMKFYMDLFQAAISL